MISNYVPYHMHTCLSTCTTQIDSMTQWAQYVQRAADCGMKAIACTEHGNILSWYNKKVTAEKFGLKYIHGVEAYIAFQPFSADPDYKPIRENFHCVLLAKNHQGMVEINRLVSSSFRREDKHFYYYPRVAWSDLIKTSDNVIITSACLGGVLRHPDKQTRDDVVRFFAEHRDHCFLEVQHHLDLDQMQHNKELAQLARRYKINLIAGTDTHAIDDFNAQCRIMMQRERGIHFDNEDNFDVTFKDLDQLVSAYKKQGSLSELEYMAAIDNTNLVADMVEPITFDKHIKYPQIFDDPSGLFDRSIEEKLAQHPELVEKHGMEVVRARIEEEKRVFKARDAETYMLLYKRLADHNHANGIYTGPGRGSAAGSIVCYLFDITEVDPLEYNLNFPRFMSIERTSIPDIDADYYEEDRERVFDYLLRDHMESDQIESAQIVTYQTIKLRGAIRNIGKVLGMELPEIDGIAKQVADEAVPDNLRDKYPELFQYVDGILGVTLTMGRHAAGVVIADKNNDMAGELGLLTSDKTPYPVTMLDKREVESLMYVKYDILGLDYVGLVNKTCKLAGIPRLTPATVDVEDDAVWDSLRKDTTCIFQFMKPHAQRYVGEIMSDRSMAVSRKYDAEPSRLERLALASAMLRPGAASVRDEAAKGEYIQYSIPELNETLRDGMGTLVLQESLMAFLVKFCGYTGGQSDYVRSCVAKKKGTEQLIGDIRKAFLEYTPAHYNVPMDEAERLIDRFIQTILDSSEYSFSKNHAVPYTFISYECAYLRHHYPLEFIATAFDIFRDNTEYIASVKGYATQNNIAIKPMRYSKSRGFSTVDRNEECIYPSIAPVKNVSYATAEALYEAGKIAPLGSYFCDVLAAAQQCEVRQNVIQTLLTIDFFSDFGTQLTLARIMDKYYLWCNRKTVKVELLAELGMSGEEPFFGTYRAGAKTRTIVDRTAFFHAVEDYIKAQNLPDITMAAKLRYQVEALGYITYITGRKEDRLKLCVLDCEPMTSKRRKTVWGYNVKATSIGSGKTQELTVYADVFAQKPLFKGCIIDTDGLAYERKGSSNYWTLRYYKLGDLAGAI